MDLLIIQAAIIIGAVGTSLRAGVPWPGMLGLVILGLWAAASRCCVGPQCRRFRPAALAIGFALTLIIPLRLLFVRETALESVASYWDRYFAVLGWMMAVMVLPLMGPPGRARWRAPLFAGAIFVACVWVGAAYLENQQGGFLLGLLAGVALLVLAKLWFRPSTLSIQALNTLILGLVFLPAVDVVWWRMVHRPELRSAPRHSSEGPWSYRAAKSDPMAYARWWTALSESWQALRAAIVIEDTGTPAPAGLRPGMRVQFMHCPVAVNSNGFRGKELLPAEAGAYRIVALGESTTFGWTLEPGHRPWPELLEELIRERLKPSVPVEVINAGVPGITLPENVRRLPSQILPLKPRMIISYHGANGFHLLDSAVPPTRGRPHPRYRERPIRLLAECEYRLKLAAYRRSLGSGSDGPGLPVSDLLGSRYGEAYRELIQVARTNRIRLVLANYSMAVNQRSPAELVEFHRQTWPAVHAFIRANAAHSLLVTKLAQDNSEVLCLDAHPSLDGCGENFYDLVHFTPEGDRQFAETVFAGIRSLLEEDLRSAAAQPQGGISQPLRQRPEISVPAPRKAN